MPSRGTGAALRESLARRVFAADEGATQACVRALLGVADDDVLDFATEAKLGEVLEDMCTRDAANAS